MFFSHGGGLGEQQTNICLPPTPAQVQGREFTEAKAKMSGLLTADRSRRKKRFYFWGLLIIKVLANRLSSFTDCSWSCLHKVRRLVSAGSM